MIKSKAARFILLFLVSYGTITFISRLPGIKDTINGGLRAISTSWLATTLGGDLKFNTKAQTENGVKDDNVMVVEFEWTQSKIDKVIAHARKTGQSDIQVPYRFISYLLFEFFLVPIIFLLALIIATPLETKRKMTRGAISFGIMMLFLLIKLLLLSLFSISKAQIDVYELGHSAMSFLQSLASIMTMGFSVIVAFFIWLIVVFPSSGLLDNLTDWFENRSLD